MRRITAAKKVFKFDYRAERAEPTSTNADQ